MDIESKIKNSNFSKVKLAVSDIDGILRGKYIHKEKFLNSLVDSIGFCDVIFGWDAQDKCYDNSKLTGWHTGYPDAKAKIDLNTFREIPWENSIPFFIADFSEDENYSKTACPRSLLKRVKSECEAMGFKAKFAQEFEWFNFETTPNEVSKLNFQNISPLSPGMFGYSILRTTLNNAYFSDLFDLLEKFNIPLEGLHTETGPGVIEATIIHDDILSAADKALLFKTSVKEIAYKHNIMASFMAKWNIDLPGCGGHIHQSLWDINDEANLFYNKAGKAEMSEILENYLAGQLACLPEILPMYAPNINSYKRIGHGDWAPANTSWGIDNRTTAIRYIPGKNKSTRIELRVPGADVNPYLAMAAALASGLFGIKNKLKLDTKPTKGSGYKNKNVELLPDNLFEATTRMANSETANELFGKDFVEHFTQTRFWEWKQFLNSVSDWELKRYFEII